MSVSEASVSSEPIAVAPSDSSNAGLALALRVARGSAVLTSVAMVVLVVWVVVARTLHPVEVEWMTGAMRDAIARARDGQPLYAAPSTSFISFLYPPLYFWITGALARLMGVIMAAKVVSLVATIVTCGAIHHVARQLGAHRAWSIAGGILHFGAYSLVLYFYDLERVDPLEGALAMTALALLLRPGNAAAAAGGALMALAYFAKQPALLVLVAAIVGLLVSREWKRMWIAAAAGAAVIVPLFVYLHVSTGGWFEFYCLKLPSRHGIEARLVSTFFIMDLPKAFLLAAATVAFCAPVVRLVILRRGPPWRDVVFASVLGAGVAGAFFLRAHDGGWTNVLLAWTPFGCAAVAVVASRLIDASANVRVRSGVEVALCMAFVLQLLTWSFDPADLSPGPTDDHNEATLRAYVKKLEERGEVLVTPMGDVTKVRHFHSAALFDVLRADYPFPEDYRRDLEAQRFAAIVTAVPNETMCPTESCKVAATALMASYFIAGHIATPISYARIGYKAQPTWVLLPRKKRLDGVPLADLAGRQIAEAAIAEMRFHVALDTTSPDVPYADIEMLAEEAVTKPAAPKTEPVAP